MVNKKGWIRIVESMVAILLVLGVLLALNARKTSAPEESLDHLLPPLLQEVSQNMTIRALIITQPEQVGRTHLEGFVRARLTDNNLNFSVRVCDAFDACAPTQRIGSGETVYSSERILLSTSSTFNPRKVKLYLWRNSRIR